MDDTSRPIVAAVRGAEPVDMVLKALNLAVTGKCFSPNDKVLIKPNYVVADHPSTGVTTEARVVEGVVKFLRTRSYVDQNS